MLSLVLLIAACAYSSNRKEIDRSTVKNVNLKDFMGKWYEIARFDHRFERGMTDITATYTLLDNGKIKVVNRGIRNGKPTEAIGKAKITDIPGQLRVLFLGILFRLQHSRNGQEWRMGSHRQQLSEIFVDSITYSAPE